MYNILLALRLWGPQLQKITVCVHCDNESAVTVVRTSKTKDLFSDTCLRNLWLICATLNIDLRIKNIRDKDNTLADAFSRQQFENMGDVTWDVIPHGLFSLF